MRKPRLDAQVRPRIFSKTHEELREISRVCNMPLSTLGRMAIEKGLPALRKQFGVEEKEAV